MDIETLLSFPTQDGGSEPFYILTKDPSSSFAELLEKAKTSFNTKSYILVNTAPTSDHVDSLANLSSAGLSDANVLAVNGNAFLQILSNPSLGGELNKHLFLNPSNVTDIEQMVGEQIVFLATFHTLHMFAMITELGIPPVYDPVMPKFEERFEAIQTLLNSKETWTTEIFGVQYMAFDELVQNYNKTYISPEDDNQHRHLSDLIKMIKTPQKAIDYFQQGVQYRLTERNNAYSVLSEGTQTYEPPVVLSFGDERLPRQTQSRTQPQAQQPQAQQAQQPQAQPRTQTGTSTTAVLPPVVAFAFPDRPQPRTQTGTSTTAVPPPLARTQTGTSTTAVLPPVVAFAFPDRPQPRTQTGTSTTAVPPPLARTQTPVPAPTPLIFPIRQRQTTRQSGSLTPKGKALLDSQARALALGPAVSSPALLYARAESSASAPTSEDDSETEEGAVYDVRQEIHDRTTGKRRRINSSSNNSNVGHTNTIVEQASTIVGPQ